MYIYLKTQCLCSKTVFCKDPALLVPGSKAELDSFHKAFLADWFILPLSPPMEEYTLKSTEDMSPLDRVCVDGCGSTREANRYPPDPNSLFLLTFRPRTKWHCGLILTFLIHHFHFYFCPKSGDQFCTPKKNIVWRGEPWALHSRIHFDLNYHSHTI